MSRFLTLIIAGLIAALGITATATHATAAKKKIVLPRTIVQVADIPLLYRDDDALNYRYHGRLAYWDENGVRIYTRLEDLENMADRRDSRCAFENNAWQETLDITLRHIPSSGRDVDLKRYYETFIVAVLTNNERMAMTVTHENTMEAWQRNLQDVIRIIGTAGAKQGIQCLAMLGNVAAEDIEAEKFVDRVYWRQETLNDGEKVRYFFIAKEFFPEKDD